ncbi:MAG: hypothetical protein ABSG67_09880 [Thermoguttaceae bacterium]
MEYIIQLDPQSLETLKAGEPIESDIPPGAGDVRSIKFFLGTEKPPRISPPSKSIQSPPVSTAEGARMPTSNLPEIQDGAAVKLPKQQAATPGQTTPRTLIPDPAVKPLTALNEPADGIAKSEATSQNRSEGKKEEPAKPWMPLILVSLGLFASLGGNAYLAWIFADLRRRYRAALAK